MAKTIMEKVTQINELVIDMAASAEDQAASLRDVNRAALEMDRLTHQNAGMVQETTSATHELRSKARQLLREMMRFKIRSAPDNTVALRPAPMRLRA